MKNQNIYSEGVRLSSQVSNVRFISFFSEESVREMLNTLHMDVNAGVSELPL